MFLYLTGYRFRQITQIKFFLMLLLIMALNPLYAEDLGGKNTALSTKAEDNARQALAPKADDESSEKNLEKLFNKSDKNYSLLDLGDFEISLSAEYYFIETVARTGVFIDGKSSLLDFTADSERTVSSTLNLDFGLLDNISLGLALPTYVKYNEQKSINTKDIGDTRLSIRWQPFPSVSGQLTTLLSLTYISPTGPSPYEVDFENELATGQGYESLAMGATFFKIFDPLVVFGGISYQYNFDLEGLDQEIQNESDGIFIDGKLREVQPGDTLTASAGVSYAITYEFTLTMQYNHSISNRSTFISEFSLPSGSIIEQALESTIFDTGVAKITFGWRGDQDRYLNVHVSLPVTDNQPDIILGVSLPLYIN